MHFNDSLLPTAIVIAKSLPVFPFERRSESRHEVSERRNVGDVTGKTALRFQRSSSEKKKDRILVLQSRGRAFPRNKNLSAGVLYRIAVEYLR